MRASGKHAVAHVVCEALSHIEVEGIWRMDLRMGSPIWIFDEQNRLFEDDAGHKTTTPNERFYWQETKITDENHRSWLFSYRSRKYRIDKKTYRCETATILFTEADVERTVWITRHSLRLSQAVRACKNYEKLQAIAAILD